MKNISWGAVLYGALTGFASALFVFLILGIAGLENDLRGQSVLIFLLYTAFLLAGFVAGRFAASAHVLHGGTAAVVLFGLQAVLSAARPLAVAFGGVVATVIGSAGGALGQWSRDRNSDDSHRL